MTQTTNTININELDKAMTYSVKDESPRGYHTTTGEDIRPGDMVVINDRFTLVTEDENKPEYKTVDEVKTALYELLEDNEDILTETITELDNYNGYLGDDRYYNMEDFDELMTGREPWEIARSVYYGDFRPCDSYFGFNGYGNLTSCDFLDYSDKLDDYLITEIIDNYYNCDFPEDVEALLAIIDEMEA